MKTLSSLALAASLALGTALAMAPLAPAMAATTKAAPAKTSMVKKPTCTPSKDKKCPVHHKVVKHNKKSTVTKTSAKKAPVKAATDKTPVKPAAN